MFSLEGAEPLRRTRHYTLDAFGLIYIGVTLIITIARLIQGQYINCLANTIAMLTIGSALLLSHRGHFRLGSSIAAYTMLGICFVLIMGDLVPPVIMMPQLALSMAIYSFVIEGLRSRIAFIIVAVTMMLIASFHAELSTRLALGFAFQMAAFAVAFQTLVFYLERQDRSLNSHVKRLKSAIIKARDVNEKLNFRNDELVSLSHIMSHDLKAPLTAIKGCAEVMLKDVPHGTRDPEDVEFLGYINDSVDSMTTLINDILQYSRLTCTETPVMGPVDLNAIMEQVLPFFQLDIAQGKAEIEVNALPVVLGHSETLRTVFQNLISNGIKYQPIDRAGHIPNIRIWSVPGLKESMVYVADNGIGVDEAFQPHIFTAFCRSEAIEGYEGTGLGMSICKHIMEQHGGDIELMNTSPEGSTFVMRFPNYPVYEPPPPLGKPRAAATTAEAAEAQRPPAP